MLLTVLEHVILVLQATTLMQHLSYVCNASQIAKNVLLLTNVLQQSAQLIMDLKVELMLINLVSHALLIALNVILIMLNATLESVLLDILY